MNRTFLRAVLALFGSLTLAAVLAARPWSSKNSFRQMRLFAPSVRVQNFRTMDEIFPARTVHRGPSPHRFETKLEPLPASFQFGSRTVVSDEFLERTVTTGLLVLDGNTILAERYFRGASADSPMTSWSVAKSVVSLLIGVARSEGHLTDLNAPLANTVTEFSDTAYGKVPLRDALTMSSGIAFSEEYDNPLSDIHTLFSNILYFRQSPARYLANRSAEAAPGARFHYASSDTFALGLALSRAVEKPLAAYLEEKLWIPLGMEYDATWNTSSDDGDELAFCCLNVRLRDYAKIGRLAARRGDWDGKRIVPEEWLREATRIEPARAPGKLPNHDWGYGYQWWIPAPGTYMAAGVWGQFIYVDPEREVVIVKTSVDPEFMPNSAETVAFFQAVASAL